MTILDIVSLLDAEVVQEKFNNIPLTGAYTSDLLSDVMANAKEGGALITIQAHKNTVAVAKLVNINLIILCNNKPIEGDGMLEASRDEGIAVIRTKENQFTVSGKLYAALHRV